MGWALNLNNAKHSYITGENVAPSDTNIILSDIMVIVIT
jgi:hypothetical protein